MHNLTRYTLHELLDSPDFLDWVNTNKNSEYWTKYLLHFPTELENVELAKSIITANSQSAIPNSDLARKKAWKEIESQIQTPKNSSFKWLAIALFLIIGFSSLFLIKNNRETKSNIAHLEDSERWIEYTNDGNDNWPLNLPDGSQVILEPRAYLKYPVTFDQKSRRVQLKGDAFFDISHDTLKPFYVYANEAVIRVLGTSFFVEAEEDAKDIKVTVKTGKVAVYRGDEVREYQAKKIKELSPLLVTPNQVATLSKRNMEMSKRLVTRPTITSSLDKIEKVFFENNSIHEIADALSKVYGVEIIVAENISNECRLTTTLTDQPLFEKLKIICDPLGLTYSEKNVKIFINGNCN